MTSPVKVAASLTSEQRKHIARMSPFEGGGYRLCSMTLDLRKLDIVTASGMALTDFGVKVRDALRSPTTAQEPRT